MVAEALSRLPLALRMCLSWPIHGALTLAVYVRDVSDCLLFGEKSVRLIDIGRLSNDLIFVK